MRKCNVFILSMGLVLCLFASVFIVSCNKHEQVYSCNEAVDKRVKKYRDANQNISRYELSHLSDLDYQMGVFLSLTDENKVRIFNEKIAAEQSNTHLSSGEKQVLNELIGYLTPEHYSSQNAQFRDYARTKESILRGTYGWDDAKVFIFTNTWMLESEVLDYLAIKANGGGGGFGGGGGGGINPCTCYYNYYCWIKGGGSGSCIPGDCTKPNGGCGVFGTTNCDGKCK